LYSALGIWGASMTLACVSCVGFPAGVILLAYGKRLRAQSRWAVQDVVGVAGPLEGEGAVAEYVSAQVAPLLGRYAVQGYGGTATTSP